MKYRLWDRVRLAAGLISAGVVIYGVVVESIPMTVGAAIVLMLAVIGIPRTRLDGYDGQRDRKRRDKVLDI